MRPTDEVVVCFLTDDLNICGEAGDNGSGPRDQTGTGGLRMTGEYKGWSVLEAWADRSVRKWQEAGLYANDTYPPWEKGKVRQDVYLSSFSS